MNVFFVSNEYTHFLNPEEKNIILSNKFSFSFIMRSPTVILLIFGFCSKIDINLGDGLSGKVNKANGLAVFIENTNRDGKGSR